MLVNGRDSIISRPQCRVFLAPGFCSPFLVRRRINISQVTRLTQRPRSLTHSSDPHWGLWGIVSFNISKCHDLA